MSKSLKVLKSFLGLLPLLFMVLLSVFAFIYVTPDVVVDFVGIENAYVLMFLVAFLAGLTTFNTLPYYSILLVLANSGLNLFILGLSSAIGVMTGDSFSYFVGYHGGGVAPERFRKFFEYIFAVINKYPKFFPFLCFFYGSFSPFSNDVITIPSGIAKISFFRVIIPLALGNIVFNITMAHLAVYAHDFIWRVFLS